MKNLQLATVIGLLSLFVFVAPVSADTVVNCVEQYGGGTVCGETTDEEVVIVDTAIGDVNPAILSIALLAGAGVLFTLSKKARLEV